MLKTFRINTRYKTLEDIVDDKPDEINLQSPKILKIEPDNLIHYLIKPVEESKPVEASEPIVGPEPIVESEKKCRTRPVVEPEPVVEPGQLKIKFRVFLCLKTKIII